MAAFGASSPAMERTRHAGIWLIVMSGVWLLVAAPALWIGGVVADVVAGADPTGSPIDQHRLRLAFAMLAWGPLSAAAMLWLTQWILGRVQRQGLRAAILLTTIASCVAAALELALVGWGAARFGEQGADPELLGWTVLLPPAVIGTALSALASTTAPRETVLLARGVAGLFGFLIAAIVASNIPGAFDGVSREGAWLGAAMAGGVLLAGASIAHAFADHGRQTRR